MHSILDDNIATHMNTNNNRNDRKTFTLYEMQTERIFCCLFCNWNRKLNLSQLNNKSTPKHWPIDVLMWS